MNNISVALAAHYAQDTTTLATCWKVTLSNGAILGFTSASANVVYGGVTYLSAAGHIPSTVVTGSDLSVDNLDSCRNSEFTCNNRCRLNVW